MKTYFLETSKSDDFGDIEIDQDILNEWDSTAELEITKKFQVNVSWENCHTYRCGNNYMDNDLKFSIDSFIEENSMQWPDNAMCSE